MGRIDGRLIRRGALLFLFVGGGLLFAACAKPGQPSQGPAAAFDASATSGNAPLTVTFTDHSTGTITDWLWDFGDTATSTTQSPTHTFDAGGTYPVVLTVNGAGGTSTTFKAITVNAPPVVSISAPPDNTISAPDLPVTFTGTATDPEDGDLSSGIQWSSSIDGALGDGPSISTSALNSGTHTITASVTDGGGATSTATITVVVNAPPDITITSPETGATFSPGDPIPFTGSAIDVEDGDLSSSIQWSSSKDGALGSGASITSSLTSGAHTITASVTDSGGKTSTATVSITVNAAPVVSITTPGNGALYQLGDTVALSGTASDPEDGDLSPDIQWTSNRDGPLGIGASIEAFSLSAGTHTITAAVVDSGGKISTTSVSITVNAPPTVSITSPANGALYQFGDPVTFTGTAGDSEDGDLSATIQWSSSQDGDLGTGASVNATSLSDGGHVITASVTDTGGKTVTSSIAVTVNAAPVVNITAPPDGTISAPDLPVTFTGTATDLEDGDLSSGIQWSSNIDGVLGSGPSVTTSALSSGTHTITASVTDTGGKTSTASVSVVVNAPPGVAITSPVNGAVFSPGEQIQFAASALDLEDGDVSSGIQWTSDNVLIGTGPSINVSSLSTGAHVISAHVTDSGGKTGSDSITINVSAAAPQANFSFSPSTGPAPLTVSFTDTSTGDVTSWAWAFTGGASGGSSGPNVTATFPTPGVYTATLFVTGPGGSSTHVAPITVTTAVPQASFVASPTTGFAPLFVSFADTSTGSITSRTWDFGDGGGAAGQNVVHTYESQGSYNVKLSVSGPGGSATATKTIIVQQVNNTPAVAITSPANGSSWESGASIPFTATAVDTEDGNLSSSLQWFSDLSGQIGSGASFQVSNLSTGPHSITAQVTDSGGKTGTSSVTIQVGTPPPTALFGANPTGGFAPLDVAFTDGSTGSITSWAWTFGDGGTSTSQNPTHTYSSTCLCVVTLQVSGPGGQSFFSKNILVATAPSGGPGRDPGIDPTKNPSDPSKIPG